jgi:Icc-related predicted phosphoesterase
VVMRILAISDTHGFHKDLKDFSNIDMIIHGGDFSNAKNPMFNQSEAVDFLDWYNDIPVKYKVLIAGNHDTSVEARLVLPADFKNIVYLEHEYVEIEGIKIFGSPYTPQFGGWAFMRDRGKLDPFWEQIPYDTDILVTHGPPKGILDLSYNREDILEYYGDKELLNHVHRVNPKHMIFGHIHNFKDCYNKGTRTVHDLRTQFHNVSCVTDRKFELGLTSKGIIIEY